MGIPFFARISKPSHNTRASVFCQRPGPAIGAEERAFVLENKFVLDLIA